MIQPDGKRTKTGSVKQDMTQDEKTFKIQETTTRNPKPLNDNIPQSVS